MTAKLPPGPREPRLLQNFRFTLRPAALMESAQARYGDMWTLRLPGKLNNVVVADPERIEDVFTADPEVVGGAAPPIAKALLGEHSLILIDGLEHMNQRKLLAPGFHGDRVQRSREVTERICERELAGWPLNEPLALLPRLETIALKAVMSFMFGAMPSDAPGSLLSRVQAAVKYSTNPMRLSRVWLAQLRGSSLPASFVRMREPLDAAIFEEIERARRDPGLEERDDILAILVRGRHDDGSAMTDRELRDQVITLLMQGHTSTASALAWALERLMRHPAAFDRLRAEAQTSSEDYLDAVCKETLRVRPPLPFPTRRVNQPFRLGEYELEPGTRIMANGYMVHRHPKLFPEPERFRPERFLEHAPHKYAWIPFGGGVRGCPGANFALLEFKVVLRTIARRARLAPTEERAEEIRRRAVGFIPSRGARAILEELVPAAGLADVAAG